MFAVEESANTKNIGISGMMFAVEESANTNNIGISGMIHRFLDSKHQISNSKQPDKNLRRMIFKLPYIGNASVLLKKELESFYRRKLDFKVRL